MCIRDRYQAGMDPLVASKDINLDSFSTWGDAERIAVNVNSLYREFKNETLREDIPILFTQMADLAKNS